MTKKNLYMMIGAVSALALSAACTVTESSGAGGAGAAGGTTAHGGSGGTGTGGGGATGGGATCDPNATCFGYLTDPNVTYDDLCAGSQGLVDALSLCTCGDGTTDGACNAHCPDECGGGTGGSGTGGGGTGGAGGGVDPCESCITTQCDSDFNACTADTGG